MRHIRQPTLALAVTLASLGACRHDGSAGPSPLLAAGTYVLESTTGRGAASGTIVLSAAGTAERRVRYPLAGGGLSAESVARGTFRLRDDGTVDLRLSEGDGPSPYIWRPLTNLNAGLLQLRHPDPADGPDIVESYRRQ
jgi:hypothetical protein